MASAATSTAMALIVLAAMSSDALPTAHADAGFISRTGKKTNNATVCLAMPSDDPKSAYATTEHDLVSITLEIAIVTVYNNTKVIAELAEDKKGTPEEDALLVFNNAYLDADNDLDLQARVAFDYADYAGASKVVSLTKGTGDACENAFKRINKKSLVTDIDQQMTKRCGVTANLMDLLVPK